MELAAGHKLAHYEILEPIGKGGMGEVYRAKDSKLGRDVAVKVLPDEFARDAERLARFRREAESAQPVEHRVYLRCRRVGGEETSPSGPKTEKSSTTTAGPT